MNGERAPATGMEKHFLKVIKGEALAASNEEKEWFQYWQTSISANSTSMNLSGSQRLEEILNEASHGKFRGCFERDTAYGGRWKLNFFFRKERLGIVICNKNSDRVDVLLKQLQREDELQKLHITLLRFSDTEIFGDRQDLLNKFHKARALASNAEHERKRRDVKPVKSPRRQRPVRPWEGGWTSVEQGEKHMGDEYFVKQKIDEGMAGDRDAVAAMRKADFSDMKKRSRGD